VPDDFGSSAEAAPAETRHVSSLNEVDEVEGVGAVEPGSSPQAPVGSISSDAAPHGEPASDTAAGAMPPLDDVSRETSWDTTDAPPAGSETSAPPIGADDDGEEDEGSAGDEPAAPITADEQPIEAAETVAQASSPVLESGPWPRPPQRRVMTVANQKGGVGKTTSTVNLAAALALHGVRVLVIDLDPQGNASTAFSVEHPAGTPSIYDVLIDEAPLADVSVLVEGFTNLWCAPATIDLAGAEIELVSVVARESRLRRALESMPDVDYVFIDCPPSLGLLTLNAMVAANEVLIPIQCEFYALEGLSQLLNNVELVKKHLNAELSVSTILLTMYDARTRLAEQVANEVRSHFGPLVIDAVIPRSVRISEAPGFGQPVVTFDPMSRGARAYFNAAHDLAQRGTSVAGTDGDIPEGPA
jgi:chromosome partitioning protein